MWKFFLFSDLLKFSHNINNLNLFLLFFFAFTYFGCVYGVLLDRPQRTQAQPES